MKTITNISIVVSISIIVLVSAMGATDPSALSSKSTSKEKPKGGVEFTFRGERNIDQYLLIGKSGSKAHGDDVFHPFGLYRIPGDLDPNYAWHPKNVVLRFAVIRPGKGKPFKYSHRLSFIIEKKSTRNSGKALICETAKEVPDEEWFPVSKITVPVNIKGFEYYTIPFRTIGDTLQCVHVIISDNVALLRRLVKVDKDADTTFGLKEDDCIVPECFQAKKSLNTHKTVLNQTGR